MVNRNLFIKSFLIYAFIIFIFYLLLNSLVVASFVPLALGEIIKTLCQVECDEYSIKKASSIGNITTYKYYPWYSRKGNEEVIVIEPIATYIKAMSCVAFIFKNVTKEWYLKK